MIPKKNKFEFINGGRIVAEFHTHGGRGIRPGRIVIVHKEHGTGTHVVAWQGVDDQGNWQRSWDGGHYCSDMTKAIEVFTDKVSSFSNTPSAPGVYFRQQYLCGECAPVDHENYAYIYVAAGQKCSSCLSVVGEGGKWKERSGLDAMRDAVEQ